MRGFVFDLTPEMGEVHGWSCGWSLYCAFWYVLRRALRNGSAAMALGLGGVVGIVGAFVWLMLSIELAGWMSG